MKYLLKVLLVACCVQPVFGQVITCGDAMKNTGDANLALHSMAQIRAQKNAEDLMGKPLIKPYSTAMDLTCVGEVCKSRGTPESTANLIEVFWCETLGTPLHSAYYSLYTSSKIFFDPRWLQ